MTRADRAPGADAGAPAPPARTASSPPAPAHADAPAGPSAEAAPLAGAEPEVDVSVLIPVLNEADHLERTVEAMRGQDLPGTFELLFVDGGSTDDSVGILRRLGAEDPRIRVLHNPERIVPTALNVGLRAARGRYVARMDAHTDYGTDYLRLGVERLAKGDVQWVSGPPIPVGRDRWSGLVSVALGGGLGRGASNKWRGEEEAHDVEEWELTTSVFVGVWRRETLDELGGWDPRWIVNEDSEMASRALARGWRLVCRRDMAARYVPRNSLKGLGTQYRRYGEYRAWTFTRHPESCGPIRLTASLLPVVLSSSLLPGRVGRVGRLLTAGYAVAVAGQVVRLRPAPQDAGPLAAILVTMHTTWGVGFLTTALRLRRRRSELRDSAPRPLRRPTT